MAMKANPEKFFSPCINIRNKRIEFKTIHPQSAAERLPDTGFLEDFIGLIE